MSRLMNMRAASCLLALMVAGGARADLIATESDAVALAMASSLSAPSAGDDSSEASSATPDGRKRPLAAVLTISRPANVPLTLWSFITGVRAQQQGDRFAVLEVNTRLLAVAEPPVAPVPLPAAAWFLVMGLLGLAGTRLGLSRREPSAASAGGVARPV